MRATDKTLGVRPSVRGYFCAYVARHRNVPPPSGSVSCRAVPHREGGGRILPVQKFIPPNHHPTTYTTPLQKHTYMPAMAAADLPDTDKPKQEGWTHVKSKSRFRRNAPRPSPKLPGASSKPDEPRIHKSVADITTEYDSFKTRWRDTACHTKLRELVETNAPKHRTVRKAVCLGVGTFDPEDGGWDAKRRTYIQLDGFLTVVEVLCMSSRRISQSCRGSSSPEP